VVRDVSQALSNHLDAFVQWPTDEARRATIKEGFFAKTSFPNVIGCVDCIHVGLQI
jgi:hypothetical protein